MFCSGDDPCMKGSSLIDPVTASVHNQSIKVHTLTGSALQKMQLLWTRVYLLLLVMTVQKAGTILKLELKDESVLFQSQLPARIALCRCTQMRQLQRLLRRISRGSSSQFVTLLRSSVTRQAVALLLCLLSRCVTSWTLVNLANFVLIS